MSFFTLPEDLRNTVECSLCEEVPRYIPKECSCTGELHRVCRECFIPCMCHTSICPHTALTCSICAIYMCHGCDSGMPQPLCPECFISLTCTGCSGSKMGDRHHSCSSCDRPVYSCREHAGGLCRLCGCRCETCGAVFPRVSHGVDVRSDPPADGVNMWPSSAACPSCQSAARSWKRLVARDALVLLTPLNSDLAEKIAGGLYRDMPIFPASTRTQVVEVMDDIINRIQ